MTEAEIKIKLREVLDLYGTAKIRRTQLERRLRKLRTEAENPVPALHFGKISRGNFRTDGAPENLAVLIQEAEDDVAAQAAEAFRMMARVQALAALLPEGTMERAILEYKHIDGFTWREICDAVPISRTSATRHYKKALTLLARTDAALEIIKRAERDALI